MSIEVEKLYDGLGQTWRLFVGWRNKIFAGYLAILAALAIGYWKTSEQPEAQAIFPAVALVLSIVFWILDYRTNQLVNSCQLAAEKLEGRSVGAYGALNSVRERPVSRWLATYGTAKDILVSSVVVVALSLWIQHHFLPSDGKPGWWHAPIGLLLVALFVLLLHRVRKATWAFELQQRIVAFGQNAEQGAAADGLPAERSDCG